MSSAALIDRVAAAIWHARWKTATFARQWHEAAEFQTVDYRLMAAAAIDEFLRAEEERQAPAEEERREATGEEPAANCRPEPVGRRSSPPSAEWPCKVCGRDLGAIGKLIGARLCPECAKESARGFAPEEDADEDSDGTRGELPDSDALEGADEGDAPPVQRGLPADDRGGVREGEEVRADGIPDAGPDVPAGEGRDAEGLAPGERRETRHAPPYDPDNPDDIPF